jgi:hypothetical protein
MCPVFHFCIHCVREDGMGREFLERFTSAKVWTPVTPGKDRHESRKSHRRCWMIRDSNWLLVMEFAVSATDLTLGDRSCMSVGCMRQMQLIVHNSKRSDFILTQTDETALLFNYTSVHMRWHLPATTETELLSFGVSVHHIVTWSLKAGIVQPDEKSIARQRLDNEVSAATDTQATTEELLETIFSVRSVQSGNNRRELVNWGSVGNRVML